MSGQLWVPLEKRNLVRALKSVPLILNESRGYIQQDHGLQRLLTLLRRLVFLENLSGFLNGRSRQSSGSAWKASNTAGMKRTDSKFLGNSSSQIDPGTRLDELKLQQQALACLSFVGRVRARLCD